MNFPAQQQPAPAPDRLGQGTAVEQSRAVAEVQAAIYVARQFPRDIGRARNSIHSACQSMALAGKAFYRFPRAGGAVEGSTIHLAKTLAQSWGNIQYGVTEMRRDDEYRQSEMQAWAWDVENNTRHVLTFIVPHAKFANRKVVQLEDLRDIYENNANNGARRLREAIFATIPDWFIEEAEDLCRQTLNKGDGKPLPERIEGAIQVFAGLGVSADRLEQKLGRKRDQWTGPDIAQLLITHKSIQRREIAVEDEFPQARITAAEIKSKAPAKNGNNTPPPDDDPWAGQEVRQPGSGK
ncbi:hypothetical protein K388_05038 [Streptomyces sp. KhCrAH-43]|uniref:hypothetical protein n=1 Tax=unclassified Streptomyces TaxID=2593676 RepID=UPI000380212A|nr:MULTISPECIES: hypothetical protein [unclassified Streptomyces]RAJ54904.1 hypothetical protein K388_05038 [Streptomyces sp. KhCrAH-43]